MPGGWQTADRNLNDTNCTWKKFALHLESAVGSCLLWLRTRKEFTPLPRRQFASSVQGLSPASCVLTLPTSIGCLHDMSGRRFNVVSKCAFS